MDLEVRKEQTFMQSQLQYLHLLQSPQKPNQTNNVLLFKQENKSIRLPLSMLERIQAQLCQHIPGISQNLPIQRVLKLYRVHSEPDATEKAPFPPLNVGVLAQESYCSFSPIPHIYISQKAPESYDFTIRNWRERMGKRWRKPKQPFRIF